MEKDIRDLLEEEIKSEINDLSNLTSGSKEKSTAIDDLVKLYRLKIEETKTELESMEKREESEERGLEYIFKKAQFGEQVKDRYFKIGIEVAGLILPLIFYGAWMRKGFKFEETGTYTSTTFRGLFNRFKPTK